MSMDQSWPPSLTPSMEEMVGIAENQYPAEEVQRRAQSFKY